MRRVLVTWIGNTDLRAPKETDAVGVGPIVQALQARPFDEALLISDYDEHTVAPFARWLHQRTSTRLQIFSEKLSGPTQFGQIYKAAARACEKAVGQQLDEVSLTFHLSPGTPAMAAVWIILAKTRFPAELIESSRQHGVRTASVPFDISADFLPDLLRRPDRELESLSAGCRQKPQNSPTSSIEARQWNEWYCVLGGLPRAPFPCSSREEAAQRWQFSFAFDLPPNLRTGRWRERGTRRSS